MKKIHVTIHYNVLLVQPILDHFDARRYDDYDDEEENPDNVIGCLPRDRPKYPFLFLDIGYEYILWITTYYLAQPPLPLEPLDDSSSSSSVYKIGMEITEYDLPTNVVCENAIPITSLNPTVYVGTMSRQDHDFPPQSFHS